VILLILVSIAIIGYLIYNKTLNLNIGIIISLILIIIYPLILAVLPSVIDYGLQAKPNLAISNIELVNKFDENGIQGYVIKASITNKGKKNCLNPTASFQIHDSKGGTPNLLNVSHEEKDGNKKVETSEQAMRNIDYAWIVNGETINKVEKLRQNDVVEVILPHEETGGGIAVIGGRSSYSFDSEVLIRLQKSTQYTITVAIKGEDSDGCTIAKERIEKITL
jgi:hypothetical protein